MDVKEAGLFDAVASRILRKSGDVDDAKAGCIVGLVGEAIKSLCNC